MKYTKVEKSWMLYDAANSAFSMIITTTIPIYFGMLISTYNPSVNDADITSFWGTITSVSIFILAVLTPLLGSLADYQGMKKRLFTISLIIGVSGLLLLNFTKNLLVFIGLYIAARIGYAACNVFYDSMLTDVTTDDRMDEVSANGYAAGYIGSCIPFVIGILIIMLRPFGMDEIQAYITTFIITAFWWLALSFPLLKNVKHVHYVEPQSLSIFDAFRRLKVTLGKIKSNKNLLFYILAYFFYIDGVYTIISMATIYGSEVGIDTISMIIALLATQLVAFPCVIITGKFSKKIGSLKLLKGFIIFYIAICLFGFQLDKAWEFWVLAGAVGMVQGGIQAVSRSYFARIIPKHESNEYFGFFDIFGKFADFLGPLFLSLSAVIFNASKYGILMLILLFGAGYILLSKIDESSFAEETDQQQ